MSEYTLGDLKSLIRRLDGEGLDTGLLRTVAKTLGHRKWRGKQSPDVVEVMAELVKPDGEEIRPDGSVENVALLSGHPAASVLLSAAGTIAKSFSDDPACGEGPEPEVVGEQFSIDDEPIVVGSTYSIENETSPSGAKRLNDELLKSRMFPGYQTEVPNEKG